MTADKAGGLFGERLKGGNNTVSCPKAAAILPLKTCRIYTSLPNPLSRERMSQKYRVILSASEGSAVCLS
jgi:hypothetical protein